MKRIAVLLTLTIAFCLTAVRIPQANMTHDDKKWVKKVICQKLSWVDVRCFGADGNDDEDDSSAFASALMAVPEKGILFIPHGRFRLSSWVGFELTKEISIVGEGKSDSVIVGTSSVIH